MAEYPLAIISPEIALRSRLIEVRRQINAGLINSAPEGYTGYMSRCNGIFSILQIIQKECAEAGHWKLTFQENDAKTMFEYTIAPINKEVVDDHTV